MSLKTSDYEIVGGLAAPCGTSPFDRAPVLAQQKCAPEAYLQVHRYLQDDGVDGKHLSKDEFGALVRSEQAVRLGPMLLCAGVYVWVLRPTFVERGVALEELLGSSALLSDKALGVDGSWLCVVKESPQVHLMQERWAATALKEALEHGQRASFLAMLEAAQRGLALERVMSPRGVAIRSLASLLSGDRERAEAYFEMARRSRGEAFEAAARMTGEELMKELSGAPTTRLKTIQ